MSIAAHVRLFATLLALAVLVQAAAGAFAAWRPTTANTVVQTTATALRNHVEADMMHDALRGTVYAAFYAARSNDALAQAAVTRDVQTYGVWFHRVLEDNQCMRLTSSTR